jgi:hypothetical protein
MSWSVVVEALLLRHLDDGSLAFRQVTGQAPDDADLDRCAHALAGPLDAAAGAVLHSTSWRVDRPGRLVVTYAALPDPVPYLPAVPLVEPAVVVGPTALRPSPLELHAHHVAAHAVRHLADLAERDPVVRAAAARSPALWAAVASTAARTPAADSHDQAHRLAAQAVTAAVAARSGG